MDPVLNIVEFARLDGLEWDQERALDDDVDMRRRIFDHAEWRMCVGFAKLTCACERFEKNEALCGMRLSNLFTDSCLLMNPITRFFFSMYFR